jgi:hypothetical protein
MGLLVSRLGVAVGSFAVRLSGDRVLLGLLVLADLVMMRSLVVMVRRGVMVGRRQVMMLRGGMLCFFRHRHSP